MMIYYCPNPELRDEASYARGLNPIVKFSVCFHLPCQTAATVRLVALMSNAVEIVLALRPSVCHQAGRNETIHKQ